jgi:hypothetical protein
MAESKSFPALARVILHYEQIGILRKEVDSHLAWQARAELEKARDLLLHAKECSKRNRDRNQPPFCELESAIAACQPGKELTK